MSKAKKSTSRKIESSSTAEYFAKNLQQVGFSSPTKAVLTTLKEAFDNALDACEENKILPEIRVVIKKIGKGAIKNTDRVSVFVEDNGPGIDFKYIPMVFGQYLASSKFGKGRCSRGQQGIGISAATTWAMQTSARGVKVKSKVKNQKNSISCIVYTDLKGNKGVIKEKKIVAWDKEQGTSVDFLIDGRLQLKGEGGILTYLRGNVLLNPHLTLHYDLPEMKPVSIARVTKEIPVVPESTAPHPHTMKLGEFISYLRSFGRVKLNEILKNNFSRLSDKMIAEILKKAKIPKSLLLKTAAKLTEVQLKNLFASIQDAQLLAPSTNSVMSIGEKALSLSIMRLGEIDYFSVVTRKPCICDFKPVQVEVAVARLKKKDPHETEGVIQVLRFANRVPLQFDKSSCAIVKAIVSVNWKSYGIRQSKNSLPSGPYIMAISVISPFIKFKNASKETIDASDDLVTEIRKALMKAGQGLSRHLRKESKAKELETKTQHIEKFSPILVDILCRIVSATKKQRNQAEEGINKILGRDNKKAEKELDQVEQRLNIHIALQKNQLTLFREEDHEIEASTLEDEEEQLESENKINEVKKKKTKTKTKTKTK